MGSPRMQHSKFRNTGILFELLVRQVTADTLGGKTQSTAINIIREYFKPSTELGKELALYQALYAAHGLNETRAEKLIQMVVEQRRKLSTKSLNEQKYALVKCIKDTYPLKEFFACKIPQYKVYASIYKTMLAESAPKRVDIADIGDIATARFTIIEHLIGTTKKSDDRPELVETLKQQDEALRLLTYRILVERFNDKYQGLDDRQKTLLREYINNVSNTNSLRTHINAQIPLVRRELEVRIRRIPNKVTQIKLHEVVAQLEAVRKGTVVRDNEVTALMIAYQLVREIDECLTA